MIPHRCQKYLPGIWTQGKQGYFDNIEIKRSLGDVIGITWQPGSKGAGSFKVIIRPQPVKHTAMFSIPETGEQVHLVLFNQSGALVRSIVSGSTEIIWDGTDASGSAVPAGIYLYNVKAGDVNTAGKIIKVE